jgi:hypothetical protein
MTTTTRKPILDPTGKVRQWLDDGGFCVWENREIGVMRHDILTPLHARQPHWAYEKTLTIFDASECLFYLPGRIVKSWSDTPSGYRAAQRALDRMPDETRDAPIGRIFTTYTLHPFTLGSITIRPDSEGGTILDTYGYGPDTPDPTRRTLVHVEFRVGIREWSAIERTEG